MLLININVELKLKWTKYCVLAANGYDNTEANPNDITFTIKDTKQFVPVDTLPDNKDLDGKDLVKRAEGFERYSL